MRGIAIAEYHLRIHDSSDPLVARPAGEGLKIFGFFVTELLFGAESVRLGQAAVYHTDAKWLPDTGDYTF